MVADLWVLIYRVKLYRKQGMVIREVRAESKSKLGLERRTLSRRAFHLLIVPVLRQFFSTNASDTRRENEKRLGREHVEAAGRRGAVRVVNLPFLPLKLEGQIPVSDSFYRIVPNPHLNAWICHI